MPPMPSRTRRSPGPDIPPEDFLAAATEICRILGEIRADRDGAPVLDAAPGAAREVDRGEPPPRRGTALPEILDEVRRRILPSCRRNDSPRFFGYVCSGGSDAGTLADFLASGLNQNVTAWRSAPSATDLERLVVDWIREITGMPRGSTGLLLGGGSAATLTALAAARDAMAGADIVEGGLLTLGREMVLYASDQVHMSVPRAASLLGLGRQAVRIIPAREDFTLDTAALARAVAADRRAGRIPFAVAASAGTTATGAIDPLDELADLCRDQELWLHVDAAYGGFAALCPEAAGALAGMGRAHSLAIDPHKWIHVPFDCGALLVRDPAALRAPFGEVGAYARTDEGTEREGWTFFEHGPELSRRFRALKVWMVIKHLGLEELGEMVREDLRTAGHLATLVEEAGDLELMAPVPLSTVCFRYAPAGRDEGVLDRLNRRILQALQEEAAVYPTHAVLRGRFALRACILNPRSGVAEMERLISEVRRHGEALTRAGS